MLYPQNAWMTVVERTGVFFNFQYFFSPSELSSESKQHFKKYKARDKKSHFINHNPPRNWVYLGVRIFFCLCGYIQGIKLIKRILSCSCIFYLNFDLGQSFFIAPNHDLGQSSKMTCRSWFLGDHFRVHTHGLEGSFAFLLTLTLTRLRKLRFCSIVLLDVLKNTVDLSLYDRSPLTIWLRYYHGTKNERFHSLTFLRFLLKLNFYCFIQISATSNCIIGLLKTNVK